MAVSCKCPLLSKIWRKIWSPHSIHMSVDESSHFLWLHGWWILWFLWAPETKDHGEKKPSHKGRGKKWGNKTRATRKSAVIWRILDGGGERSLDDLHLIGMQRKTKNAEKYKKMQKNTKMQQQENCKLENVQILTKAQLDEHERITSRFTKNGSEPISWSFTSYQKDPFVDVHLQLLSLLLCDIGDQMDQLGSPCTLRW